jgi:hypothetical protein
VCRNAGSTTNAKAVPRKDPAIGGKLAGFGDMDAKGGSPRIGVIVARFSFQTAVLLFTELLDAKCVPTKAGIHLEGQTFPSYRADVQKGKVRICRLH